MSQTQTSSKLMQRALSCERSASVSARRGLDIHGPNSHLSREYASSLYSSRSAFTLVLISVGAEANLSLIHI